MEHVKKTTWSFNATSWVQKLTSTVNSGILLCNLIYKNTYKVQLLGPSGRFSELMVQSTQHVSWNLAILFAFSCPAYHSKTERARTTFLCIQESPDNIPDKVNIEHHLFESLTLMNTQLWETSFLFIESDIHVLNFHSEQGHSIFHKKPFKYLKTAIISLLSLSFFSFHSPSYFNSSVPGSSPHMCFTLPYAHTTHFQPSWQHPQSGFHTSVTMGSLPFLNWILLLCK